MKTTLTWKRGIFSNSSDIYKNGEQIGKLKNNCFSQSSNADLNGVKYTFRTKGLFRQHTEIIDDQTNAVIGEITYNTWMTKATLVYQNNEAWWKCENIWNTRWSISDSEGIQIYYKGNSVSGVIESDKDDELLLLSGLFVPNYYWQMAVAVMIILFIPVWTSI